MCGTPKIQINCQIWYHQSQANDTSILKLRGQYLCLSMCVICVSLINFKILKRPPSAYFIDAQGEYIFHFKKSIVISTAFLQPNSSTLNVHWSLDTN